MSILRNKVLKPGLGPKKLSYDIQSLMSDYYQEADPYSEVRKQTNTI